MAPVTDGSKGRWQVRVVRAGLSGNGVFYPDAVLRAAVPLFAGTRVLAKSDEDHLAGRGKDLRNLVGRLVNPAFVAGDGAGRGEIRAELELIDPAGPAGRTLQEAHRRGMGDLFGLSIDAVGATEPARIEGRSVRQVRKIAKVNSVDLVLEPAAGGQIINLIEALGDDAMEPLTPAQIEQQIERSKLPTPAKERLRESHSARDDLTETGLREAIAKEADYLARFTDSGKPSGLGDPRPEPYGRVQLIEGAPEKTARMLDTFFDPADNSVVSIRDCYLHMTGDRAFSGLLRNCDQARLREALGSSSFGEVLGDSVARRMVAEYRNAAPYDVWRDLVSIVPITDFRVQERTRFGGYGDLPVVAENDPYLALGSPTDEVATYQIAKHGGTESVTLEMIANDDAGAIMRIPRKLARAAKRTVSKFVLDFLKDNPVIYDNLPMFHEDHANLGSTALAAAAVSAARVKMKRQREKDSGDRLGIGPRFLWVPDELEEEAYDLFRRDTNLDQSFVQSLSLQIRPVWYWEDVTDWCLSADPLDIPAVEMGFFQGNEEPELFVQDNPTLGSMFSHDRMTYKIRHIYGGTVTDYRGLFKAVVAG